MTDRHFSMIDPFPLRTKLMMDFVRRMVSPQDIEGLPAGIDLSDLMRIQQTPEAERERLRLCRIAIDGALKSQKYEKADDHVTDFVDSATKLSKVDSKENEKKLKEKLEKAAKLQMIHDFVAAGDRRGLSDAVWDQLKSACDEFLIKGETGKKRDKVKAGENQTARLGDNMMAIIREDGIIRLVSSLSPRGSGGIDVIRLGGGKASNVAPLMNLMEDVPECPFIVIIFKKSTFTMDDIVVNVPEQFLNGRRGYLYLTGGVTIDLLLADDLVSFFGSFRGLGKTESSRSVESRLNEYFVVLKALRSSLSDFSTSIFPDDIGKALKRYFSYFPDVESATIMDLIARLPDCSPNTMEKKKAVNYTWEILEYFLSYSVKKNEASQ